jgi:hypothetical protein
LIILIHQLTLAVAVEVVGELLILAVAVAVLVVVLVEHLMEQTVLQQLAALGVL